MPTTATGLTTSWLPQHFSYVFVAGASLLGLGCPTQAPIILAPLLLIGLVVLGLAHGACDQLVLPALAPAQRKPGRRMLLFVLGYLGLAALVGLGWWYWPTGAVAAFFLLTVWHWGSADATAQASQRTVWLLHSLLRGSLFFALPAHWWPVEARHSMNGLLLFAGSAPVPDAQFTAYARALWMLVGVGHLILWGYFTWQREVARAGTDVREVALLTALFIVLPPLLATGIYFVFWHSLQHALRLNRLFGFTASRGNISVWRVLGQELVFFVRRAVPLVLLSLAGLVILYFLLPAQQRANPSTWLSLALAVAAMLTLPHALLVSVVMDAANWRRAA